MTIANFNPADGHVKTSPSALTLKRKVASPLTILMLSALSLNTAHAALTATTAQTIKGSAPYFKLRDTPLTTLDELLGFTYPGFNGDVMVNASQAGQTLIVPKGTQFKQLIAAVPINNSLTSLASLVQTGNHALTVSDDDGDSIISNTNSANGSMMATFIFKSYDSDGNGNEIKPDLSINNETFDEGCFDQDHNYRLTIAINPEMVSGVKVVNALTQYGEPNASINYYNAISTSSKTVTYHLKTFGICAIKPKDMTLVDDFFGGTKFNPATWQENEGFSVSKMKTRQTTYPKTGFPHAELQIIGSGNDQSIFECRKSAASANWVSLLSKSGAGTNCTVNYNTTTDHRKPTGDVTIELGIYTDGQWLKVDDYTIPAPTLWAEAGNPNKIAAPYSSTYSNNEIPYNLYPNYSSRYLAAESCYTGTGLSPIINGNASKNEAELKFFTPAQLTNRPNVGRLGSFYRDADGTFMGEWGALNNYPDSPWYTTSTNISSWTSTSSIISSSETRQSSVTITGGVDYAHPSNSFAAVCKRD